ncbi:DUF3097 family protein, partial [Streptomyces sp. BE303]|uniref:DUF3097 family protein n=1 Tax=Streptomyces sp. BE303 TaxID=3002528 RepID=UPI003FA6D83D
MLLRTVQQSCVVLPVWPAVPRGEEWQEGVCRRLGWPVDTPAAWKRILASVD